MRISDWSSDVCSSDLIHRERRVPRIGHQDLVAGAKGEGHGLMQGLGSADGDPHLLDVDAQAILAGELANDCLAQRPDATVGRVARSEEHTSEPQSLMRNSYALFCLKKQ